MESTVLTIFNAVLVSWYKNNTVTKTIKLTFNFLLGDLWKLDDTTLMDNKGIWQSPNEWNFLPFDKTCNTSCQMYIENASNKTLVLGIEGNIVNPEQPKVKNATVGEFVKTTTIADLPCCAVTRIIEQCCFNSTPDPFNGQTANFTLKPPKVIESRTYVKKANLECY